MQTSDLILIALVIVVPAGLLWLLVLREGAPGRRRLRIPIPPAMRPGTPDEVLEGPRLERIQVFGVLATLVTAVFIPAYWLPERDRQEHYQEMQQEQAVERGKLIFDVAPVLPEDADPAQFRRLEEAIALGQGCARCHGGDAGGGFVTPPFVDPVTGENVQFYRSPPLNNVFQRWDEEVVRFTIERGRPGTPMPAWGVDYGGSMTDQMVSDVIAYLRSLPGNQEAPPPLPQGCDKPAKKDMLRCGQSIFAARCAVCHGPQGQGRDGSGKTDSDPRFQGMALWKGKVRHLGRGQHLLTVRDGRRFAFMPPFAETPSQGIPAPTYPLTDAQIRAVVEYERSL